MGMLVGDRSVRSHLGRSDQTGWEQYGAQQKCGTDDHEPAMRHDVLLCPDRMVRTTQGRFPTAIRRNAPSWAFGLRIAPRGATVSAPMAVTSTSRKPSPRRSSSSRRIIVVVVSPVDHLDLGGPLQVFNP